MTYHDSKHSTDKPDIPDYDQDFGDGKQNTKNTKVRKRIDELLEEKRLKQLLDGSDYWEI